MMTFSKAILVLATAMVPGAAFSQDYEFEDYGDVAQPTVAAPEQPPPAPATTAAPVQQLPSGQWTYTSQYGWVWLPYDQAYTNIPADGSYPSIYAYYPSYGWRWLTAPWIYSVGPRPHWGLHGITRFAWHSRPWFRVPSHYAHYRGGGWGHRSHVPAPVHRYAPTRGHRGGGHASYGSTGGHRRDASRGGHEYRPSGGGHRGSGGQRGPAPSGGSHRGGHGGGAHSARPAPRR